MLQYTKEFDSWNEKKKKIETREEAPSFKEGEVWWMHVGVNVGSESCGKGEHFTRPVLVLRKVSKRFFIGIPTSIIIRDQAGFITLPIKDKEISFLLLQTRAFAVNRMQKRQFSISDSQFTTIKQELREYLKI